MNRDNKFKERIKVDVNKESNKLQKRRLGDNPFDLEEMLLNAELKNMEKEIEGR